MVELAWDSKDELGEGPLWNGAEQALYWVDIENGLYHRLKPASGEHETVGVGELLGALAFRRSGGLVLAGEHGLSFFDPAARAVERIGNPEAGKSGVRFNDGKVDRAGRFWAGTLGDADRNALYRLDADSSIHLMQGGVSISNGIGWSPDNRVMYYVDSTPACLYAYDFDLAAGTIENRRVLVDRSARAGVPDGLTVDAAGCIWVAVWGGACVEQYDPAGKLMRTLDLPVACPTSVAFGGPGLDDLYITSARVEIPPAERERHPLAGCLFRVSGLARGLPEPAFAG